MTVAGGGDVLVVLCTVPSTAADALVEALLREALAACVNSLGPVRSRYRWQGRIETAEEVLLVIKTRADLGPALQARIRQLHPYDVPEVLQLAVADGLPAYLDWVRSSVRPASGPPAPEQR